VTGAQKNILIGVLFAALVVVGLSWFTRGETIRIQENTINESASWALSALCDSYNHYWVAQAKREDDVVPAMENMAVIWRETAGQYFWSDRLIGEESPSRLYVNMRDATSQDEFNENSDALEQFCTDNWDVLFRADDAIFPRE